MIHKEGTPTIILTLLFICILNAVIYFLGCGEVLKWIGYIVSVLLLYIVLQFFRNPSRKTTKNDSHIISPADGKVVVIEEVMEEEYFHDKRLQVSIFMSPFNVHVNRYPMNGAISYYKYHPGKYLVAWHPKSSTENERTTVVVKNSKCEILFRQIAGALARRIVFYGKQNDVVEQGSQCGFIKFGSRVDLFFPVGTKLNIKLNDVVTGGESVIAFL
ncbi:MAG TPA: phosphatidylserine decarboxylase family protein [Chitinophagaceae bacterium]|jgi:phosphatidylserine decarboxylase|nr:phosphatidylserine decarboxylase family protein [Chitinophagaceae bacterium]